MDVDLSDGKIFAGAQKQSYSNGYTLGCSSQSTITATENTVTISSTSGSLGGCSSRIICTSTDFDSTGVTDVKIKTDSVLAVGGNGDCVSALSLMGLQYNIACPNRAYSEQQRIFDVVLKEASGRWLIYDLINPAKSLSQSGAGQISFSVESGAGGGSTSSTATIAITDIIVTKSSVPLPTATPHASATASATPTTSPTASVTVAESPEPEEETDYIKPALIVLGVIIIIWILTK